MSKDTSEPKKGRLRKAETMRDKVAKADKPRQPRRLKRAGTNAVRPFRWLKNALTREYYLIVPKEKGFKAFLTKPRKLTPRYFRNSYRELKLVTWPNRKETWKLMVAVFIFSLFFGLTIAIVDFGLDKLFRRAFL